MDLNSSDRSCARLGSEEALSEWLKIRGRSIVLVHRHRRAVGAAVRRAVDDEVPGTAEEETGPAAVNRVPSGLLDALPVHAFGALGIVVVVRDVGPPQIVLDDSADATHVLRHLCERAHREDQHAAPVVPLERGDHLPVGARRVAVELDFRSRLDSTTQAVGQQHTSPLRAKRALLEQ